MSELPTGYLARFKGTVRQRRHGENVGKGTGEADPINVHVGHRLRERRKALQMSQKELGDSVGCSGVTIQNYEEGKYRIAISALYAFSRVLSVNLEYFVGRLDAVTDVAEDFNITELATFMAAPTGSLVVELFNRMSDQTKNTWIEHAKALIEAGGGLSGRRYHSGIERRVRPGRRAPETNGTKVAPAER